MNYTKPNESNHEDSPKDWLNSSLLFARTLSLILEPGHGIVVDVKGDVDLGEGVEKVIVFNRDEQIVVESFDRDLEEGTPMKVV
jgi:hypothetical protein